MVDERPALLLSIDFEDWHQLVHRRLRLPDWDRRSAAFERQTAATFDLLDALGARATFFLPADVVQGDRGLLSSLSAAGEIQNGGTARAVSVLSTPFEVHRQVARGSQEIRGATGRTPTYYLPAKGSFNPAAYLGATSAHQRGVVGSLRIHTARGAARTLRPGDVVVLDLTNINGERARRMLATFLDRAQARGLRIVDLSSVSAGADVEP